MFTAIVVACYIANQDMCMQITDNRGPYQTKEQCFERLNEMSKDLMSLWYATKTPVIFKSIHCEKGV